MFHTHLVGHAIPAEWHIQVLRPVPRSRPAPSLSDVARGCAGGPHPHTQRACLQHTRASGYAHAHIRECISACAHHTGMRIGMCAPNGNAYRHARACASAVIPPAAPLMRNPLNVMSNWLYLSLHKRVTTQPPTGSCKANKNKQTNKQHKFFVLLIPILMYW